MILDKKDRRTECKKHTMKGSQVEILDSYEIHFPRYGGNPVYDWILLSIKRYSIFTSQMTLYSNYLLANNLGNR